MLASQESGKIKELLVVIVLSCFSVALKQYTMQRNMYDLNVTVFTSKDIQPKLLDL